MTIACVFDNGSYVDFTIALQEHFDHVLLYDPLAMPEPTSNQTINRVWSGRSD